MSVLDEAIRKRAGQEVQQQLDEAREQIEKIAQDYCVADLVDIHIPSPNFIVPGDFAKARKIRQFWEARVEAKEREIARKVVNENMGLFL